jgi:SAM-dependent methyltransferase
MRLAMSTSAFEGRAAAYAEHRAAYPSEAIECAIRRAGLTGAEVVVDLGAGTGLLCGPLLGRVRRLYAVEPASDMRRAAEAALGDHPAFQSVAGTAEETSLTAGSIDVATSGNAFHYFDPERARRELDRILCKGGRVILLYNEWPRDAVGFTSDYLELLRRVTPPALRSAHANDEFAERLAIFLDGRVPDRDEGEQCEQLAWSRLAGRFASTSIAPAEGAPEHDATYAALRQLFDRHAKGGGVSFSLRWICLSVVWS